MMKRNLILLYTILIGFASVSAQCYELVWADEFNYSGKPDPSKWTHEVNGDGGGNNELQFYTDRLENSRVQDSMLIIEAHKENYEGKSYTSARLISYNKASFKYGKMEARIKLPYGQGIWPAFWMLGDNIFKGTGWPACGEIDILEMIGGGEGRDDKLHGTIHWSDESGAHTQLGGSTQLGDGIFNDEFHVFSIEWTEDNIKWFLDGEQYYIASITASHMSEFHKNFFLLLNLAVGGNWPGSPNGTTQFPQQMWVDYVRVYQAGESPEIEGPSEVLKQESDLQFKLVEDASFTYDWTVPVDAEIVSGQGTSAIAVNWGCLEDTVRCSITTVCSTHELTFPVKVKELSISGETRIHTAQRNVRYEVAKLPNTDYEWILPEGAATEKNDSNVILVNFGDSSGMVSVILTNECGKDTVELEVEAVQQLPYLGQPQRIPGEIRSVYFDKGGEGIAYHDTDAGNNGPGVRQEDDVDTEPGDNTGNIGWTFPGEWLEYSVEVEEEGLYDLECRTAGLARGGSFRLLMNGRDVSGETMANTASSWTTYRSVFIRDISLTPDDSLMRLEILTGDFNMASMNFTKSITGLEKTFSSQNIFIYPTIVTREINIRNLQGKCHYRIINIAGLPVKSGIAWPDQALLTDDLVSGLYVLVLQNEIESTSLKFLKIDA